MGHQAKQMLHTKCLLKSTSKRTESRTHHPTRSRVKSEKDRGVLIYEVAAWAVQDPAEAAKGQVHQGRGHTHWSRSSVILNRGLADHPRGVVPLAADPTAAPGLG